MDIQEMLALATTTNDKINVSPAQLKQLELFVVAYMSAAQLELENAELSKSVTSSLDNKWDSLFNLSVTST